MFRKQQKQLDLQSEIPNQLKNLLNYNFNYVQNYKWIFKTKFIKSICPIFNNRENSNKKLLKTARYFSFHWVIYNTLGCM